MQYVVDAGMDPQRGERRRAERRHHVRRRMRPKPGEPPKEHEDEQREPSQPELHALLKELVVGPMRI